MGRGQEPSLSASLEEAKVEAVVGALICPGHNEALMTAAGVGRRVRSPLRCTGVSRQRRHLFRRGPPVTSPAREDAPVPGGAGAEREGTPDPSYNPPPNLPPRLLL